MIYNIYSMVCIYNGYNYSNLKEIILLKYSIDLVECM